jgi:hypothetical protein
MVDRFQPLCKDPGFETPSFVKLQARVFIARYLLLGCSANASQRVQASKHLLAIKTEKLNFPPIEMK